LTTRRSCTPYSPTTGRSPEKGFARGASREQMRMCEDLLGLKLEDFYAVALEGMREVREELGL